ncbi:TIR domain-containing protein [Flavobacterium sp. DGU11]|uniref:TIR domain-containing protein n=1 Tax=Flavobacterium arundinis TaxID=3139143 RepID=A0ABU9HV88_9FLAO
MTKKKTNLTITHAAGLIEYLEQNSLKSIKTNIANVFPPKNTIIRKTFRNITFKGDFHSIEFKKVKFKRCEFEGIWGFYCLLQECEFEDCSFRNCRFSHLELDWNAVYFLRCYFRNIEIDEGCAFNLTFDECHLNNCSFISLIPSENIRFYNSNIDDSLFQSMQHYEYDEVVNRDDEFIDILFQDCNLTSTNFHRMDFKNGRFVDSILYKVGFMDCVLETESFILNKELQYGSYASMDFQTILQSEDIGQKTLSYYFNIKNKVNLKEIISGMTTQKNFSTVFISYSFKDSDFAKKIAERLNNHGIRTFIWEKDAPGGKPLEEIMTSNISAHDKLLFIASKNSIRSRACQFELTTARKKQEASWENVFFPISIDNYLFEIKKINIRPIELANEYWENIEEIKRVNTLDFSAFKSKDYSERDFDELVQKIIDGLQINT